MAAPIPPVTHGPMSISPTFDTWGGVFSFSTTGAIGTSQQATITDANFTSRIIRTTNKIFVSPANSTAAKLFVATTVGGTTVVTQAWAQMTNNASIIVNYPMGVVGVQTARYFFVVYAGGTTT